MKANTPSGTDSTTEYYNQLRAENAALKAELAEANREASSLAMSIWRSEYQKEAPNFGLCDSVAGIITQIDNMYAGIRNQRDTFRFELAARRSASEPAGCRQNPHYSGPSQCKNGTVGCTEPHHRQPAQSKDVELLYQQRDELVALLNEATSWVDKDQMNGGYQLVQKISVALAKIVKKECK